MAGVAGALLLVDLLRRAVDVRAVLDRVRAGLALRQLPTHAALQDVGPRLEAEDGLVEIDAPAGPVIRPQVPGAQLRRPRKDFVQRLAEADHLLDAEVGAGQVEVQVGRVADRRDITTTSAMPSGAVRIERTFLIFIRSSSTGCRRLHCRWDAARRAGSNRSAVGG